MKVVKNRELKPISQLYYCPQDNEFYINYSEFAQNMPCAPKVQNFLKKRVRNLNGWQSEDGSSFFVPLTVANDEICLATSQINSMGNNFKGVLENE